MPTTEMESVSRNAPTNTGLALRIKDWDKIFETAESRKLKILRWVPVPNKMNGEGYTDLVEHPNGAAHLGGWLAILEIASTREGRDNRGKLPEGDGTIQGIARSLSRMSRLPMSIFEELIPRLLAMKWLESNSLVCSDLEVSGEFPITPADAGKIPAANRREWNGIEGNGMEKQTPPSIPPAGGGGLPVPAVSDPRKHRKQRRTTEEIRKDLGDRLPWWEHFWRVFPCHEGINPGMDAFDRKIVTRDLAKKAYFGAERYAARARADPTTKLKYAQGWINEERWEDENKISLPANQKSRDMVASVTGMIQESLLKGETPW